MEFGRDGCELAPKVGDPRQDRKPEAETPGWIKINHGLSNNPWSKKIRGVDFWDIWQDKAGFC